MALMASGEYGRAAGLLAELVKSEPAAENWNDLSFAHLKTGEWRQAMEAAQEALKLEREHPYALYNFGLAALELRNYLGAEDALLRTARLQPDRHEPHLALARVYRESRKYGHALYHVEEAEQVGAPGSALAAEKALVEAMVERGAPADLADKAVARLTDGEARVYLYPGARALFLFYVAPGRVAGVPLGDGKPEYPWLKKVDLPGGQVGYWVKGDPVGAYVSRSVSYRLIAVEPGGLRQVIFVGNEDWPVPHLSDFMRSMGAPDTAGDKLIGTYGSDASGKTTMVATWQLQPGAREAVLLSLVNEDRDPHK